MMTTIAGDNHAQLQCMTPELQVNGNHVLCPVFSDSGTVYWELLQLLIKTGRRHEMTATVNRQQNTLTLVYQMLIVH